MNKGISQLIAGVLLIAFTLAVAAIVSGWLVTMIRGTTKQVGEATEEQTECVAGLLEIITQTCQSGRLDITIQNSGTVDLTNFTIFATIDTTSHVNTSAENSNTILLPGEVVTLTSRNPTEISGNITKIRVSAGNCPQVYREISGNEIPDSEC